MKKRYVNEPLQEKLERFSVAIPFAGCIVWIGAADKRGYGKITLKGKTKLVHRVSYEHFVGEIPKGLEIDHLCRNPSCINPIHLEPVTKKVNNNRGLCGEATKKRFALMTHCKRNHEFTVENTYVLVKKNLVFRNCRACRKINDEKRKKS